MAQGNLLPAICLLRPEIQEHPTEHVSRSERARHSYKYQELILGRRLVGKTLLPHSEKITRRDSSALCAIFSAFLSATTDLGVGGSPPGKTLRGPPNPLFLSFQAHSLGRSILQAFFLPEVSPPVTMTINDEAPGHHLAPSVGTRSEIAVVETRRSKDKGLPRSPSAPEIQPAAEQTLPGTSAPEEDRPLVVTMSFLRDFQRSVVAEVTQQIDRRWPQ